MKKHILFISYYYPPHNAIAAVRTGSIAKALVKAGFRVTVITVAKELLVNIERQLPYSPDILENRINIIGTEHSWRLLVPDCISGVSNKGLAWFIGGVSRRLVQFLSLDRQIGWRKHALAAASTLKSGEIDIVLSSGGPWISHQIAAQVSKALKCPYMLDYRDLWTMNPHMPVKWQYRTRIEQSLYHGSAAVITISPSMQVVQREVLGTHPCARVVSNGYDSSEFEDIVATPFNEFAMIYAGRFYPPKSTIDPIIMIIRQMMNLQIDIPWSFHYYGPDISYMQKASVHYGVQSKVHIHGNRPRREVLSALKGSGIVFIVASVEDLADISEAGILTGKFFEIIGLKAPYVVISPKNADIRGIVKTVGGGRSFCASEIDSMSIFIYQLIKGRRIPYLSRKKYSWEHLGSELSSIVTKIVSNQQ